jgi:ferrous-iron efflux pump FieF
MLEATSRFFHPQQFEDVGVGLGVMIFSMLATLGLLSFQRVVIRKTGSVAIQADALHYKTDLYMNASVLLALLLISYGWDGFDAVFALGIGVYILYSAWEIIQLVLKDLMDQELSEDERENIRQIILKHPEVLGMHDLRTRKSGMTLFIQLHLELDDDLRLIEAHAISDEVEASLFTVYRNAEIIIHEDPVSSVCLS